ncbi:MAG: hypothetical protein N4J56_008020 [Chroococcidiopsis sp. SAG 2025]|nr:hypothetical protein [Chroococcidiopsis sp. SAG 2025]
MLARTGAEYRHYSAPVVLDDRQRTIKPFQLLFPFSFRSQLNAYFVAVFLVV